MRPIWLVEANVTGLPSERLQAEIRRQGIDVRLVKPFLHNPIPDDILGAETIQFDAHVLFTGTLTTMRYLQTYRRWLPGGWCNFKNLSCSTYYAYFGDHLLNCNYSFFPIAEAIRQEERIFKTIGRKGTVFVRPDSVDKTFSGKLIDIDSFEHFLTPFAFDPTRLILVAEPQEMGLEWRLFVANGEIVTGCRYRVRGATDVASGYPEGVAEYARSVLRQVGWRPDPLFVMDVGESPVGLRVVELNSFSCSGPGACELEPYVTAAIRAANWTV